MPNIPSLLLWLSSDSIVLSLPILPLSLCSCRFSAALTNSVALWHISLNIINSTTLYYHLPPGNSWAVGDVLERTGQEDRFWRSVDVGSDAGGLLNEKAPSSTRPPQHALNARASYARVAGYCRRARHTGLFCMAFLCFRAAAHLCVIMRCRAWRGWRTVCQHRRAARSSKNIIINIISIITPRARAAQRASSSIIALFRAACCALASPRAPRCCAPCISSKPNRTTHKSALNARVLSAARATPSRTPARWRASLTFHCISWQ